MWPLAEPPGDEKGTGRERASSTANLPMEIRSIGLPEVGQKNVLVAVLLGLFLGPLGLYYSTMTGMIIMLAIFIPLRFLVGNLSFLIVLPICGIWAWRAARECSSSFD
ncbi:MAG: hypothetical protein WDM87_13155 [Terracidiphilus sp.]